MSNDNHEFHLSEKIKDGEMEMQTEAHLINGNFRCNIQARHPAFLDLIEDIAAFFKDEGGINFVCLDAMHPDLGTLAITIQRVEGKLTPAKKLEALGTALHHIDGLLCELRLLDMESNDEYIAAKTFLDKASSDGLVVAK